MKKICRFLALFNAFLMLCACTKETETDIYGFCQRINGIDKSVFIDESAYFFDGESQYYYFATLGNTPVTLVLETDENGIVRGVRLTCVSENGSLSSEDDRQRFIAYFISLCSALCDESSDVIAAEFSKNALTADRLVFGSGSLEFEYGKYCCFLYCGEYCVSLYLTPV